MNIYLDIETIPGQRPEILAAICEELEQQKADLQPPGNYKDPAKIEAWLEDKRAELDSKADELWRKTAFNGDRGEVVCIAWAFDDEPVESVERSPIPEHPAYTTEAEMLNAFFVELDAKLYGTPGRPETATFIGHNVRDFDLRFLYHRAVILGVKPPMDLPHDARPVSDRVFDTMTAWAGWGQRISLDRLCRALNIPTKGSELEGEEIDGARVWDFVQAGKIEEVAIYCRADVERVREVHRKLTFAGQVGFESAAA